MANVAISGDTSGAVTLFAPAVSGTTTLTLPTTNGTILTTGSPQSGGVIQVQSTTIDTVFSTTSSSFTDITGLSVSITPKFATSKILVMSSFQFGTSLQNGYPQFRMLRNATVINSGAASGSRTPGVLSMNFYTADSNSGQMLFTHFLDSPATTSATTYKMQARQTDGNTTYVGVGNANANTSNEIVSASTITVMEIAA
jgi:hypothetical protein